MSPRWKDAYHPTLAILGKTTVEVNAIVAVETIVEVRLWDCISGGKRCPTKPLWRRNKFQLHEVT